MTPVKTEVYGRLLKESGYDESESQFLIRGFSEGFPLEYDGPLDRQDLSGNIPITPGVGSKEEMWDKMLKESEAGRYAGPFLDVPFIDSYVQSPVGLVPKAGNKTRLIFHLSYDFPNGNKSINHWIPQSKCSVKYNDLDHAVRLSLGVIKNMEKLKRTKDIGPIFYAKSDLLSAFRILPILPQHRRFLLMRVENPEMKGRFFFFIDKHLSFGGSVSCSHFQRFSNSLRHIVEWRTGKRCQITNYLDDFLFISGTAAECNYLVREFLNICEEIGFPVSLEKTEWASQRLVFLGILLDGVSKTLAIPVEKRNKALNMLMHLESKNKATVKELERLSGYLNFLNKAIVPGRTFTHRMYAKFTGKALVKNGFKLRHYHHVKLDREFRRDCSMWITFLQNQNAVNRPFLDMSKHLISTKINFYSDASAAKHLGYGAWFNKSWLYGQWEPGFIEKERPSIEFLELYGLCAGVLTWTERLKRTRVTVFCDNKSVVDMINGTVSGCPFCMELIRILTIDNMRQDRRIFAEHVFGCKNGLADHLSRLRIRKFFEDAPHEMNRYPGQSTKYIMAAH